MAAGWDAGQGTGQMRCAGGYCEMCPVKIQRECDMTPIERIDHIRQCLIRMRPTMGYEKAGAAEIEKDLKKLEEHFAEQEARGEA